MVDVGSSMASSLAGIASTVLQDWNKFVGVLVVPQVDPSICRCFSRGGVAVDVGGGTVDVVVAVVSK
jgi:hypothetical protein